MQPIVGTVNSDAPLTEAQVYELLSSVARMQSATLAALRLDYSVPSVNNPEKSSPTQACSEKSQFREP